MAKMVAKANQARKKMSEIQVAGQSGAVTASLNGLYKFSSEVDEDNVLSRIKYDKQQEELAKSIVHQVSQLLNKDYDNAHEDTKKALEKKMMSVTSMDDLKDMLQ